jgi:hypothetical protein
VLSPSHWTHRKSHFSSWGDDLPEGAVVTDPYALLYLLSAASVEPSSTHLVSYIFADDRLVELRFAISGTTETAVDFAEAWPGGGRDRRGMIQVSSVRVTTDPATAGDTVGGVDHPGRGRLWNSPAAGGRNRPPGPHHRTPGEGGAAGGARLPGGIVSRRRADAGRCRWTGPWAGGDR